MGLVLIQGEAPNIHLAKVSNRVHIIVLFRIGNQSTEWINEQSFFFFAFQGVNEGTRLPKQNVRQRTKLVHAYQMVLP
jgi:hypothetical protein